jgi:RNA polymerase sigma-70 factor, ECF subfamily
MTPAPTPARPVGRLTLSPAHEGDLRSRLCARDERALVEVIELTAPWVLGLVQGMLNDPDEAEDVMLETYRTIWDKIDPRGPAGLLPLVFRIARNKAIDRLRRRKRRRIFAARWRAVTTPEESVTVPAEAATAAPGWSLHSDVVAALAELPVEQQQVIQLAYYRGMTHSEIARLLETPLGTVKTRLRLAYAKLRTSLAALKEWVE